MSGIENDHESSVNAIVALLRPPRTREQEVARDQLVSHQLNVMRTYIASQEDVV